MVNRQHGLGRGLGALLSSSPAPSTGQDAIPGPVVELPIDSISANPKQPRKDFDAKALHDLSESLKQSGLLQPVVVRRFGEAYQLVVGERTVETYVSSILNKLGYTSRAQIAAWAVTRGLATSD